MNNLTQFKNQVYLLINEEKWQEAYKICNEILRMDPDNTDFSKLRIKIEKTVKANNIKAIRSELKNIEPLLKAKKFQEYLTKISPLQNYISDVPEIGKIILNATRLMEEDLKIQKTTYVKNELNILKQKQHEISFSELEYRLEQLKKHKIYLDQIEQLNLKIKTNWVNQQLKTNSSLLQSEKYEDRLIFLLKLQQISPENTKITTLLNHTKNDYLQYKIDNKKDYLFKTIEEIKSLFITKKYEKVMILCERILEIDKNHLQAKDFLNKSIYLADEQSTEKIEKSILENYKSFPKSKYFQEKDYMSI